MKILIIGATGNAGTQVIKALQAKGVRPTAAVRNIEKAKAHLGEQVDYVYFDYLDASTYAQALEAVDRMFFIAPPPKKDPAIVRELMQAAEKAGVKFTVFQSGRTSGTYKGKPLYQIERDLENGKMNYCIVRPAWYMQNFHTWTGTTLEDNEICLPTGDGKVAMIDLKDLGAAIAEILVGEGHDRKAYNLTGSEALNHEQVASIFSDAKGECVHYSNPTPDLYVKRMVEKGWTEDAAKYCIWLFDRVKEGSEEEVSNDFQQIVGREPRSFQVFAQDEFGV
ncbi:SDR family oxidoreductase [Aureispira anguillae]|uniref:SDR family oxidoreductase n=1 Tax=Aureispira anguillae TaxID=2864201 RepID=A0A915VKC1_9BACT|nr:SDR family oxidoreductase [Aureispira anguillae]BDS09613.1 SDR family oxidoreductase [Aureispira anguillae]